MPHTSTHFEPRPPDNWPPVITPSSIAYSAFPPPPSPDPSAAPPGLGQWRIGDGRPEPRSARAGAGKKWKFVPGAYAVPNGAGSASPPVPSHLSAPATPLPLPLVTPSRPLHDGAPAPPQVPSSSETRPFFDRPYLPADVHPPSAPPIRLDPRWQGFPVEALHLGALDEAQFAHFASEREVPLAKGLLEVKLGEKKGDKVETRGEVTLSGSGFTGPAAVKLVFGAGSIGAIYYAKAPSTGEDHFERYHLVLCARWTPRFCAYKPRPDGNGVAGQVRVTALDHKHAEKVSFLSRHFLLVLRLPRHTPQLGSPATPFSLPDFLNYLRAAKVATPIRLAALPLLPSRAYSVKLLEHLDTALGALSPTLAFHLEGILRMDGTLTPSEVLRLIDEHVKAWEATAELGDSVTEDILIELRALLDEDRSARAQLVQLGRFFDDAEYDTSPPALDEWAEEARVNVVERRKPVVFLPERKQGDKSAGSEHFWCRTITVTPSGSIKVGGRVLEKSNAVIRRYYDSVDGHKESDHFLRVLFRDEDDGPIGPMTGSPEHKKLLDASVGRALKRGVKFGGRTYEFLAYSQSGLRDRAVWFAAMWVVEKGRKMQLMTAEAIRRRFGNFSKVEHMPAKLGSRFSQVFTSTHATEVLHFNQISGCDDILELDENGDEIANHTDGAGLMSIELRNQVWETLRAKGFKRDQDAPPPSVFQIRLGGSKGTLVVDDHLKGSQLQIRPSQDKFLGLADEEDGQRFCLNVADAFTRPNPLRLNRPLISALEDLGIAPGVFLHYQKLAIEVLQPQELDTLQGAYQALHRFALGSATRFQSLLRSLVELKNLPDSILREEPFLHGALQVVRVRTLRDLRDKASIPVPNAYVLVGVPDQDRVLREDQVFAALRFPDKPDEVVYLEGRIVVTRSPSIDPGDIRVVHAIGKPPAGAPWRLKSLENCLVLPTVGERAIASTMGGGDLDGDTYQVLCLPEFVPRATAEPRPYEGEPPVELDHPATIGDVADCLLKFITSDSTGIIATNHLVVADKSPMHGFDPVCQQLADLYSLAVDAAKTGNVVALDRLPEMRDKKQRPDFLRKSDLDPLASENGTSFEYYRSRRALGQLYRAIEEDGLSTPKAVHGLQAVGDSMSSSFAHLRLSIEMDLAMLLDLSPEPLKNIPASFKDTVEPILASFCAQFARVARVHSLPNALGRQLSETELFAVTSLLESQRHEAARGNAIAAMAREIAMLVNWLEQELANPPSGESDGQVDGETLRMRYSAWIIAVERGDERTFGVKAARWTSLALLLEAMRREKARRDKLDDFPSPSEATGPVYGRIVLQPSQHRQRPQPTPPPSPPIARSGRSFPSTPSPAAHPLPSNPAVPLVSRPRSSGPPAPTSAPSTAPRPTIRADPPSGTYEIAPPPVQHVGLATVSMHPPPASHAAVDPWGIDLERRRMYTRAGEELPVFDEPGDSASGDEDDDRVDLVYAARVRPAAQASPPWVTVASASSAALTSPQVATPAGILGTYTSSSDEDERRERERAALQSLKSLRLEREDSPPEPVSAYARSEQASSDAAPFSEELHDDGLEAATAASLVHPMPQRPGVATPLLPPRVPHASHVPPTALIDLNQPYSPPLYRPSSSVANTGLSPRPGYGGSGSGRAEGLLEQWEEEFAPLRTPPEKWRDNFPASDEPF